MNNNDNDKILVEIAAYKDPETVKTVRSAIIQADHPERVYFAICYQSDNLTDYNILKSIKNCKIKYVKEKDAKGSCYARYLCQQLIEDEKYIWQIDSHMRFVKHWDTKMIELIQETKDPKACISFYPPYCDEDMMSLPLDDKTYDKPVGGGTMYTYGFHDGDSIFTANNVTMNDMIREKHLARNPFVSAGNFFAYADAHREVWHDPKMYFYGDELPMAIKLFTHGFNIYGCSDSYIYHQYERKNASFPKVEHCTTIEIERFRQLVGLDKGEPLEEKLGLGKVRSFEEFEKFSGLDFKLKTAQLKAERGNFVDKSLEGKFSYIQGQRLKENKERFKKENINIIVLDMFGEFEETIDTCLDSLEANKVKFIVGTKIKNRISSETCKEKHIKELEFFDKDTTYTEMLSKLSKHVDDDCYVLIIDSYVRFLKRWDTYMLNMIKACGPNTVLTSWAWTCSRRKEDEEIEPYVNALKVFDKWNDNLPTVKFSDIKLTNKRYPIKAYFVSDGLIFMHSSKLNEVEIDPNLNYQEHKVLYALRLYTYGYDLYVPPVSFFYRTKPEDVYNASQNHNETISAMFRYANDASRLFEDGYKYDIGDKRRLWSWFDDIGFEYDKDVDYRI